MIRNVMRSSVIANFFTLEAFKIFEKQRDVFADKLLNKLQTYP